MKKHSILWLATFIVLVGASFQNVGAQAQTQTTIVGATHSYSVVQSAATGTSTYNWLASEPDGANLTYTFGTTNANSVTFNTATAVGVPYTIQVTEVSSNGCPDPSAQVIEVTVLANNVTVQFDAASLSSAACSGPVTTDLSLALTLSGNVVHPATVVVNYTVNGTARTRTITTTSATTATIGVGSEDNILNNLTTTNSVRTVIITSATIGGAPITVNTALGVDTYAYTAWLTPATSTITVTP